jgi:hypothetical protein
MLGTVHRGTLTVRSNLARTHRRQAARPSPLPCSWSLAECEEPNPGLLNQLDANPATVSGTPPNSPTGVSWPPWPTAQPHSFCASASIA